MSAAVERFELSHSERRPRADARPVRPSDPNERMRVTVYVRPNPATPDLPEPAEVAERLPHERSTMGTDEFAAAYGAARDDLDAVTRFARDHGLEVAGENATARSVLLEGTVAQVQHAFGVELEDYELEQGGSYRGRTGPIRPPRSLEGIVEAVFGLDNRKVGRAHIARRSDETLDPVRAHAHHSGLPPHTYLPPKVAELYDFPPGTDGSGECVAILAFNNLSGTGSHGGYSRAALETYFTQVLHQPMPQIEDVVVHGQGNDPGDDGAAGAQNGDSSGEVMLDVQVVGAVAPGAKIVVYFTEFSEQGWVDALNAIVTDAHHNPSVISVSYGNPEIDMRSAWTRMAIRKVNEAFRAAAARGITICCAAGDDGSADQAGNGRANADFPASSPYVLGCGGTRLIANGKIESERVWNDGPGSAGGGGISDVFGLPAWQHGAHVPRSANDPPRVGRGVPDVAGIADPETGVVIIKLDGQHLTVIGGTSATAPLWSALVARLNQALGARVGYLNPLLYKRFASGVLRDIVDGDNGAYRAGPGWDACSGLGSPHGERLLGALRGGRSA